MASITDYLSSFFVTQDSIDTANQVAAAQQKIASQQLAAGTITPAQFNTLSTEITSAGNTNQDYVNQNSSLINALEGSAGSFFSSIPWFVYAGLFAVAFIYVGGLSWLRGIFRKGKT